MSSTQTPSQAPPGEAAWVEAAAPLMNDQCWCWGQDVLYPGGNLLVRYGLERVAGQGPRGRSGVYTRSINDHGAVWLRGAGVFYSRGSGAGIFLGRYDVRPRVIACDAPPLEKWSEQGLGAFPMAVESEQGMEAACLLVPEVCAWIADYELWIAETAGVEHREQCLQRWPKRSTPAEEFSQRWRELGHAFPTGAPSH